MYKVHSDPLRNQTHAKTHICGVHNKHILLYFGRTSRNHIISDSSLGLSLDKHFIKNNLLPQRYFQTGKSQCKAGFSSQNGQYSRYCCFSRNMQTETSLHSLSLRATEATFLHTKSQTADAPPVSELLIVREKKKSFFPSHKQSKYVRKYSFVVKLIYQ